MIGRLVAKILFKACVPLVIMVSLGSYMLYLRGGDPAAVLKHVAGGAFSQALVALREAKDDASSTVQGAVGTVGGLADSDNNSASTEVFVWKDADGVTHYSNSPPVDANSQSLMIDPSVNLLSPVNSPSRNQPQYEGLDQADDFNEQDSLAAGNGTAGDQRTQRGFNRRTDADVRRLEAELGGELPGVAGQRLLNHNGLGGIDAAEMLKLLQATQGQQPAR